MSAVSIGQNQFESDTIDTSAGELVITFLGHGSLGFLFADKTIYVDPWSRVANYSLLPRADLILVTHHHGDHFDPEVIKQVQGDGCPVILTGTCLQNIDGIAHSRMMENGEKMIILGLKIDAIPAYNIKHKRETSDPFHPKGEGNGYIITFGDTRVLVAGDTENTPEVKALKDIDIAFLPMNLPYTMTPEMVADAARAFRPGILYPYHFGNTDPNILVQLLKDEPGIEVRVRKF